jgi:hypothetical protein
VFFVNLLIGIPAMIPARRLLRESRDETATKMPDLIGAALLAGGVALLALGLVKGGDWGWGSAGVLGSFIGCAILVALFVVSSVRHPAPVVEFALFKIRSFTVATIGQFVFGAGFYALLICNVLFLTGVWHMTPLTAGFAMTPGPIGAAICAPFAGRLADKYGQRAIAVPGGLLFGLGALIIVFATTSSQHYFTEFLPGSIITGFGVGFTLPAFGSAAVAEIPLERFGTGIGISMCLRQIGAVVGITALVLILPSVNHITNIADFHHAYLFMAISGLLSLISGFALGNVRTRAAQLKAAMAAKAAAQAAQAEPAVPQN